MAGGGLFAVLDDIAALLDDVAVMSKLAAKKTAGIVGDDLAVNANAIVGIDPKRELPIIGKIALGSLANKAILIPVALMLPAAAITPLLMFGGAFLCYEAFHKIAHRKDPENKEHHKKMLEAIQQGPEALLAVENKKIKQAILTDTILSAEIIAVALGTVAAAPLAVKAVTLSAIGLAMTGVVYGFVGGLVKLDDIGLHLQKKEGDDVVSKATRALGRSLVTAMPKIMKCLSVVGTAAMFLVGGGILVHGIPAAHHLLEGAIHAITSNGFAAATLQMAGTTLAGAIAGAAAMPVASLLGKIAKPVIGFMKSFKKKSAEENVPPGVIPDPEPAGKALTQTADVRQALTDAAEKPQAEAEKKPAPAARPPAVP